MLASQTTASRYDEPEPVLLEDTVVYVAPLTALGTRIGWRTSYGRVLTQAEYDRAKNAYVLRFGKPGTGSSNWFDDATKAVGKVVHDVAGEYVRSDPATIATHLLFKNEIITTGLEIAESQANRGATQWVGAVGAVSESMDKNPGADALLAIGGGLAWMTGGATLPLLSLGGKQVLGDAAKQVQARADQKAAGQPSTSPASSPNNLPSSPEGRTLLEEIWAILQDLLASIGIDLRSQATESLASPPASAPNQNGVLPAVSANSGAARLGKK